MDLPTDPRELLELQNQLNAVINETTAREAAMEGIIPYMEYMKDSGHLAFQYAPAPHHKVIIEHLEAMARGDFLRLLVTQPPGLGKSQYCSVIFPSWYLLRNPTHQLLKAANTADLAQRDNYALRQILEEPKWAKLAGTSLREDRRGLDVFQLQSGGAAKCLGVDGRAAGYRCNMQILDDPVGDWSAALSAEQMANLWEWYRTVWRSRGLKNCLELVVSTAWSSLDPSQQIVKAMRDGTEDGWVHLNLPWECTDPQTDACGRELGEELFPGFYAPERIAEYKANTRNWSAYWQQMPADSSDEWYPAQNLKIEAPPTDQDLQYFLGIDCAYTVSGGDYTVLATCALDADRNLHIVDIERFQNSSNYTSRRIIELSKKYHYACRYIDNDTASQRFLETFKEICYSTGEGNTYIKQVPIKNRSKEVRAQAFRSILWEDRVRLNPGPHAHTFLQELAAFPGGDKSPDQIDAISCICNELPKLSGGNHHQAPATAETFEGAIQVIDGKQFTRPTMAQLFNDHDDVINMGSGSIRRI